MRSLVKKAIIGLAALGIFVGGTLVGATISSILPGPARAPIDLYESISAKNSAQKVEAIVLRGSMREPFNFLGTDERAYLGLKYDDTTVIVLKDLFEGNGTYESAIRSIQWLDADRVLIERTIQDKKDNIEFNVRQLKWRHVK